MVLAEGTLAELAELPKLRILDIMIGMNRGGHRDLNDVLQGLPALTFPEGEEGICTYLEALSLPLSTARCRQCGSHQRPLHIW